MDTLLTIKSALELIPLLATISGIIGGIMYVLIGKYFLDKRTYNKDIMIHSEMHDALTRASTKRLSEVFDKIDKLRDDIAKDKASQEDFLRTERKVERLDNQIMELAKISQIQACKLDLLIANKNETLDIIKEFRNEINAKFSEFKEDLDFVKEAQTEMRVDIQVLKAHINKEEHYD